MISSVDTVYDLLDDGSITVFEILSAIVQSNKIRFPVRDSKPDESRPQRNTLIKNNLFCTSDNGVSKRNFFCLSKASRRLGSSRESSHALLCCACYLETSTRRRGRVFFPRQEKSDACFSRFTHGTTLASAENLAALAPHCTMQQVHAGSESFGGKRIAAGDAIGFR